MSFTFNTWRQRCNLFISFVNFFVVANSRQKIFFFFCNIDESLVFLLGKLRYSFLPLGLFYWFLKVIWTWGWLTWFLYFNTLVFIFIRNLSQGKYFRFYKFIFRIILKARCRHSNILSILNKDFLILGLLKNPYNLNVTCRIISSRSWHSISLIIFHNLCRLSNSLPLQKLSLNRASMHKHTRRTFIPILNLIIMVWRWHKLFHFDSSF